jgi:hypothetical protein
MSKPREYTLRWSMRDGCYQVEPTSQIASAEIHVREVNAEMDAWTAKLIELCDDLRIDHDLGLELPPRTATTSIIKHMKARPQ